MYRPGGQTLEAALVKNLSVICREEPKRVQIATLSVCVWGVCVCVKCIQLLGYSQKTKKKTSQRRDVYEKEEQLLCNMRPHCPPVVFYLPHQQKTQMGCETQKVEADFVGLINAT